MNKLAIGSLSLILMSAFGVSTAVAEMKEENPDTRIEQYEQRTESTENTQSQMKVSGMEDTSEVESDPSEAIDTPTEESFEEGLESDQTGSNSDEQMMQADPDPSEGESTRTEETLDQYQGSETDSTDSNSASNSSSMDTEAFDLVNSAYRGQYESQGVEGYAVMISNYNSGELTAEDVIQAGIDAGDVSPEALQDEAYVNAVELQLETIRDNG